MEKRVSSIKCNIHCIKKIGHLVDIITLLDNLSYINFFLHVWYSTLHVYV